MQRDEFQKYDSFIFDIPFNYSLVRTWYEHNHRWGDRAHIVCHDEEYRFKNNQPSLHYPICGCLHPHVKSVRYLNGKIEVEYFGKGTHKRLSELKRYVYGRRKKTAICLNCIIKIINESGMNITHHSR